jgi:hypothetical protein
MPDVSMSTRNREAVRPSTCSNARSFSLCVVGRSVSHSSEQVLAEQLALVRLEQEVVVLLMSRLLIVPTDARTVRPERGNWVW